MAVEKSWNPDMSREQTAVEVTRFLIHKHYCENDFLADETLFDEPFLWFGAAEHEFAVGRETVMGIFRQFDGQVPACTVTDEEFHVEQIAPDVCLVAGRMWIATDPATGVYLRVHQRITTCIRWVDGQPRCCMLHISNPYAEMNEDDVGFPTQMAQQSRDYMRQQLELQKKEIARQAAELSDIYNTVSCGILRLLRTKDGRCRLLTSNRTLASLMDRTEEEVRQMDWSRGFGEDVPRSELPRLRTALDQLKNPGDHSSVDYQIHTREGRVVYLSSRNDFISREPEGDIIQRLTYDISDRIKLEDALRRLGFEDSLTGLFNRNRFNHAAAFLRQRPPKHLGVACFDLNGLKEWNDRYGHAAGDDLIRRTACCINAAFPQKAYRIGGDEFVVLDREHNEADFHAAMAHARALLEKEHISISAGLCWRAQECDAWLQCEEADRLMYLEKREFYRNSKKPPHHYSRLIADP